LYGGCFLPFPQVVFDKWVEDAIQREEADLRCALVLKAFVVAVYGEFEGDATEEGMPKQIDGMMGIPEGNKVFAKFRKLD